LITLLSLLIKDSDVEWVVNTHSDLGVKIKNRFFFLYKGESLEYSGNPYPEECDRWRPVERRKFDEYCHPIDVKGGYYTKGDGWKHFPKRKIGKP